MRRIYYSSAYKYFFRYLRILSFSYYSVIKVQTHWLTSERCSQYFSYPGHRSPFNIFCFGTAPAVETIRPGTHRRVEKTTFIVTVYSWIYVCLLFNKFFFTPNVQQRPQWRWRDLNPRPSPCKGAALPLSYIPRACLGLVGLTGFEPVTPALSAQCSNQLSYKPVWTLTTEQ